MGRAFIALMVLMGTIIGAGILGIPYVAMQSGFPVGAAHIIIISALMAILMLYLGEIVLRTKKNHQLPGLASKYLNKKGRFLMFIAVAFGVYSAIVAYLIAEGRSLSYLIFDSPAYEFQLGILFWIFLSAITYFGIKALEEGDTIGVILVFVTIISISAYFANKIDLSNLVNIFPNKMFVPFGVVLFAFLGFTAIPEIKRVLEKDKKPMKKVIITAYALTAVIYLIFTAIVIGYMGAATPEVATIALGKPFIFLGMITMFTAYLSLSIAMIDMYKFDFRKTRRTAWIYTISIPLILFIILSITKHAAFTQVLGIGGVLSGGLTAILILAMIKKAKAKGEIKKPEYSMRHSNILSYILGAIFIIGAIIEIISIIF